MLVELLIHSTVNDYNIPVFETGKAMKFNMLVQYLEARDSGLHEKINLKILSLAKNPRIN